MLSYHLVLIERLEAVRLFPQIKQTSTIGGADTFICRTLPSAAVHNPSVVTAYIANYINGFVNQKWSVLYLGVFDHWSVYAICHYLQFVKWKEILKLSILLFSRCLLLVIVVVFFLILLLLF